MNCPLWFGQILRSYTISRQQRGSILDRHNGHCFLLALILFLPTIPGRSTLSQMSCPGSLKFPSPLEDIVNPEQVIAAIFWEIKKVIRKALLQEPDPEGDPLTSSLHSPKCQTCSPEMEAQISLYLSPWNKTNIVLPCQAFLVAFD